MELEPALELAEYLRKHLRFNTGGRAPRQILVGSIRRGEPRAKDLDLLVVVPAAGTAAGLLASAHLDNNTFEITSDMLKGERHRMFKVRREGQRRTMTVDLFLVYRSELPYALFHYTGSKTYNIRTRAHAKHRGWLLNQYGLFYADTKKRVHGTSKISTERQLASFLDVSYRAPTDREKWDRHLGFFAIN